MTPERSTAYGRVVKTLADMGAAKLHDGERARIRAAADTLLFAADHDGDACAALADMEHLARHLAETGRWTFERATQIADDVAACGPPLAVEAPVLTGAG